MARRTTKRKASGAKKNTYRSSGRAYYLKNRAKILKKARAYYKRNKAKIKARMKRYHARTKGKPLYLSRKAGGKRPLFPRVSAHNMRNGRYKQGVRGTQKGRKPAKSGVAFAKAKKTTTRRRRKRTA
jgi:hypothetical protein